VRATRFAPMMHWWRRSPAACLQRLSPARYRDDPLSTEMLTKKSFFYRAADRTVSAPVSACARSESFGIDRRDVQDCNQSPSTRTPARQNSSGNVSGLKCWLL